MPEAFFVRHAGRCHHKTVRRNQHANEIEITLVRTGLLDMEKRFEVHFVHKLKKKVLYLTHTFMEPEQAWVEVLMHLDVYDRRCGRDLDRLRAHAAAHDIHSVRWNLAVP